jgi:peptidoglycan hydrolase CwlO-like protein
MRVRHKIPSIFNLSMVDVLCCALGCVILLWLINLRDAKQHEDDSGSLLRQKESAIADLEQKRAAVQAQADAQDAALADLRRKWDESTRRVASLQADVDARGKDLAAFRLRADDLSQKLTDAGGRIKDLQGVADLVPGLRSQLKSAQDQYALDESKVKTLGTELSARALELDTATRKLLASQKDATTRSQELDNAGQKLTALQTLRTHLETDLEDRNKELTLLRTYKDKWSADQEQMLSLKKELAASRTSFDAVQTEKTKWQTEAARVRAEADNRFAGITLTGRRVVFLVDMSGSMEYLDDNTPAPQKWVAVRETVAKIMRSLPDLRKFQVVAFSNKAIFPLGKDDEWLDFNPNVSADLVLKTLAAVKPNGGTNMYSAMEAVFRMRPQGLDAIYFLSDGIPNMGEGVTPEEIKAGKLTDVDVGSRLGAAVRKKLKTDWNRELDGKPRVHLNTVGFFYESPDVGAFLWALARENEGSFVGMSKP